MSATLYDIGERYSQALALAHDPEIPPQLLLDTLESIEGEAELKIRAYLAVRAEAVRMAAAIEDLRAAQARRLAAYQGKIGRLDEALKAFLEKTGRARFECAECAMTLVDSTPSVAIDEDAALPHAYLREVPASSAPDKARIKAALLGGIEIPGARLVRGQHLRFR